MYEALVKLFGSATIFQLGFSASDLIEWGSGRSYKSLNEATQRVLTIEWKPISVFPEEGKRFR